MGRGRSGASNRSGGGGAAVANEGTRKTLVSKSQVGELTKDFTPEQFLGNTDFWSGTVEGAKNLADDNMPNSLDIGGYTFQKMGGAIANYETSGKYKNSVIVMMDYQSTEQVGSEFPVLQVGVSIRRNRGKVQTAIIRDSTTYGTHFW